jgi:hypothetical protein
MALALATVSILATTAEAQRPPPQLPDWSGVWQMVGPTVFDTATVEPPDGRSGDPGVRERPPYNAEWEARYRANIEAVRQGRFPDPLTYCGIPAGFPRLMNVPDVYEFIVRPEQVWIVTENGPNVMRIYTDGRAHPAEGDYWPTYTGDSVGHWEGDALVVDTIGIKSDGDTIIDRTGLVLSESMHIVMRLRKTDEQTLEANLRIEDPAALTAAWEVVKRYRRVPAGTRVYDYACAENNRNPVDALGRTLTLGSDGTPIDRSAD